MTCTHLGHVTGVAGAAEHLVHLRQLDALVVLWNGKKKKKNQEQTSGRRGSIRCDCGMGQVEGFARMYYNFKPLLGI